MKNEDIREHKEFLNLLSTEINEKQLPVVPLEVTDDQTNTVVDEISAGDECEQSDDLPRAILGEEVSVCFDGLVDVVDISGKPTYLVATDTGLLLESSWEQDDILLFPPARREMPWGLPCGAAALLSYQEDKDEKLFDDLVIYLRNASELPEDGYYELLAAWIMHTYLLEHFSYSPVISLFAVADRGKSRTGKALAYAAYRGLHVESLNPAYIFRIANKCQSTLFFDVVDIWTKAKSVGAEDVVLGRFERGIKAARVTRSSKASFLGTEFYNLFGPTIIAINEPPHPVLESRSLTINMRPASVRFQNEVTPEAAQGLCARLTAFRARHILTGVPYIDKVVDGRLGDITRPLLQIAHLVKPSVVDNIIALIMNIENRRHADLSSELEADVLRVVASLENEVRGGLLPVKRITDEYNSGRSISEQINYKKMGRRLNTLGFGKSRLGGGHSAIIWDKANLVRQMEYYGVVETPQTPQTSQTPQTPKTRRRTKRVKTNESSMQQLLMFPE